MSYVLDKLSDRALVVIGVLAICMGVALIGLYVYLLTSTTNSVGQPADIGGGLIPLIGFGVAAGGAGLITYMFTRRRN